jgi:RNA polymerase sigma factor (sigma-70 family)
MNSGYKAKLGLTKENQKHWFIVMAYRGIVIKNWHHIIPKHHEGENSELVEVTLMEHALLHRKIWKDEGCKTCYKSYRTLKGLHDEWVRIQEYMKDNGALTYFYDEDKSESKKDAMFGDIRNVDDLFDEEAEEKIYSDTDKDTIKNEVSMILDTIPDRHRQIVEMYYGINRDRALTLNEIGEEFNLTRERIRRQLKGAIKRLQHRSRSKSLRVYV